MKLTNTLSRKKENFQPIEDGKVKIYACGVTVYDLCHLGHAMQAILFDTFVRYLRYRGYEVTYVRNYTDVDDKIIERAKELEITPLELSSKMIEECQVDMESIGVLPADEEPKVSDYIPQIIDYVKTLVDKGFAYRTDSGDVYYRVRRKEDYGKLSGQKVEELEAGHRIDSQSEKEDHLDFALWKSETVEGASWDSPFGKGRPGWHIECSVMSTHLLGDHFDIHGGGRDLVFPHHENEVAQSEAYSGGDYANVWVHTGLLTLNHQKMSKSLGNFLTIKDALKKYDREVIRYNVFQVHYSSNVDFNESSFSHALKKIYYYYKSQERLEQFLQTVNPASNTYLQGFDPDQILADFQEAMDDDFNLPRALVAFNQAFHEVNEILDLKGMKGKQKAYTLKAYSKIISDTSKVIGLLSRSPQEFFEQVHLRYLELKDLSFESLNEKLKEREQARTEKDYGASDRIRDELLDLGVQILDTPEGQKWQLSESALTQLCQ